MRLRSQFSALVVLAVLVGAVALSVLAWSALETQELRLAQERAVTIASEITGLLVLTQDQLLHGELRARQQWQARYRRLRQAVAAENAHELRTGAGLPLVQEIDALPALFEGLQDPGDSLRDAAFTAKRRELLVDQLLAAAQAVSEHAYERERVLTQRRNASELRLMALSIALPAALSLLFALGGALLGRRVLKPMARLQSSMEAVGTGDLSVRDASVARDELGELSRGFDRMTARLAEREAALRASEAMLRQVTDNLPAMIGYWDSGLRNRFANADYRRWFGKTPEQIHGRHIVELLGHELYELNRPHIEAALAGRRQDFDRAIPGPDGVMRYSQASYIPDTHTGRTSGFFVLVTDVTPRVIAEQALQRALAEKDTLLKEVYHRVKNNLQVVQSLLRLQAHKLEEAGARSALDEMAQRVRAMALVHEQLYRGRDLSAVSLRRYVADLLRQLAAGSEPSGHRVRLRHEVDEIDIGVDLAIPLGLLLTELVGNAFKHAFVDGRQGRIDVCIARAVDGLHIGVCDDGVGLPPGFELHAVRSLGLQLATSLARQLGGELHVEVGPGTHAWLVAARH